MRRRNVRVILASEYPKTRHFLRHVIEEQPGAVVVGEAENAVKALTLARDLRPDFAIIDSYLPHTIGLDTLPLSRTGGLDAAQFISAEIPNAQVVLVTNMDTVTSPESSSGLYLSGPSSRKALAATIPLKVRELHHDTAVPHGLVFANIAMLPKPAGEQKGTDFKDAAIFLGGISILVGLGLTATMFLAWAGIFLAAAGGLTMFLGIAGKLASSLRSGTPREKAKKTRHKSR